MTNDDFTLYNRTEYFLKLIHDVRRAKKGDRVIVASMVFNPAEPLVHELAEALAEAAKRGVKVSLIVDAYNFLIDPKSRPGPFWYGKGLSQKMREPFRSQFADLRLVEGAGGKVTITNTPANRYSIPQRGRSHIKGAIVGNTLYIGGCNLNRAELFDVMLSWEDKSAADWLERWFQEIEATERVRTALENVDAELDINPQTSLLIDAGVPKQSSIYDEALELIDTARERIFITCQYFPGGRTAQHLLAAEKRGVQVEIIYSHPRVHGTEAPLHHVHILRERMRLPGSFFANQLAKEMPKLHAKIIATEQGAIVGSHNYVTQGVNFGTAEIALLRRDPGFSQKVTTFIKAELGL